jgi:hypothetical protein
MKKLLQIGAFLCGLMLVQSGYAAAQYAPQNYQVSECPAVQGDRCPDDHAHPDQPCGDCYCLMVHYEPCYYTTQRCVEEQVPCKKKCVKYVDKYYECQRCRQVPEYYTETYCQKEPEYYEVDDCKICKKTVCDQHCKWVPKYYWKHNQTGACSPCDNNGCAR